MKKRIVFSGFDIKLAQGQETRKCKDCGRVGCWTETDDPDYIQCKCGNEILIKTGGKMDEELRKLIIGYVGTHLIDEDLTGGEMADDLTKIIIDKYYLLPKKKTKVIPADHNTHNIILTRCGIIYLVEEGPGDAGGVIE